MPPARLSSVDREALSAYIAEHTPLTLESFEKIHGHAEDRHLTWQRLQRWVEMRRLLPEATLWKITER